jgi:GH25 family lysozyme M1 (1,4-beta-N-acetylmuramidase)
MSIWGVDVSNHQGGGIDWHAAYAGGIRFGWAKVCEGAGYRDPYWTGNRDRALAAGVKIGGYGYVHPNGDAVQQANFFCDLHGPMLPGMLTPAIDLEESNGVGPSGVHAWTHVWLTTVGARLGVTPWIYTYPDFWASQVQAPGCAYCKQHPLWYAGYSKQQPGSPRPWDAITVWQYAGTSVHVPGVGDGQDANWFLGTEADLEALTHGATPAPQPEEDDMPVLIYIPDQGYGLLDAGKFLPLTEMTDVDACHAVGLKELTICKGTIDTWAAQHLA